MPWYAIFDLLTGDLRGATANRSQLGVSIPSLDDPTYIPGDRDADGVITDAAIRRELGLRGLDFLTFPERRENAEWNPSTRDYDVPLPVVAKPITAIEFMRRFTSEERITIRAARAANPILDDFFDLLVVAGTIHVTDPDVQAGVSLLAAGGLISADRVPAILEV